MYGCGYSNWCGNICHTDLRLEKKMKETIKDEFSRQLKRLREKWPHAYSPEKVAAIFVWVRELSPQWLDRTVSNFIKTSESPPIVALRQAAHEERLRLKRGIKDEVPQEKKKNKPQASRRGKKKKVSRL